MFLLGRQLPDASKVQSALTSFYGLSRALSARLCARIQVHDSAKVADLTDAQITQLSAYLSSPGSIGPLSASPTRSPLQQMGESSSSSSSSSDSRSGKTLPPSQRSSPSADPLRSLVVETDLRRSMQANIAHHRNVGSYRGRRHQQGLPVRGQRSNSNAQTARKLNRIERRGYCTAVRSGAMTADFLQSSLRIPSSSPSVSQVPRPTVLSLLRAQGPGTHHWA